MASDDSARNMEKLSIEDDSELTEIYDAAKDCDAWFSTYSSALQKRHGDESRSYRASIAQDHQERFWAWATGIGVYAEPLISLDMRLAKHPKVQEMVLLLLNLIKVNLQEATESCQVTSFGDTKSLENNRESYELPVGSGIAASDKTFNSFHTNKFNQRLESGTSNRASSWEIRQDIAQHAIEESLERLGYLSTAIRKSRKVSLAEKVQKYVEKNDSYYSDFKELAHKILNHLYPNMDPGLKEQLAESIVFRKARILLQQRRQQTLQDERKNSVKLALPRETTRKPAEAAVNANASHSLNLKTTSQQRAVERGPAKAETMSIRPTTLDENAFERKLKDRPVGKEEEAQSTVSSAWAGKFRCPPPPKVPLSSNTAECPVCSRLCQRNQVEDKRWWRRHIKEDIQIYTCISQDCRSPPKFFSSYAMWSHHMKTHHSTNWLSSIHPPFGWCCAMEHSEPTQFDSAERYLKHFEECHPSQFCKLGPNDISLVLRSGRVSLPRPMNECPICETTANQLPSSEQAAGSRQFSDKIAHDQRIYRHVADHLMVFAEISMLGMALGPDESPEASEASQKMHWDNPINSGDLQSDTLSSLSFDSNPYEENSKSAKPRRNRSGNHQLQTQLRRACQGISNPMSNGYERTFLPKKQLYALINPESVACELAKQSGRNKDDAAIREVANLVCTDQTKPLPGGIVKTLSYRPIFAILVFIEEPNSIELFLTDGVSDLDLPLVEHEDPDLHDPGDNSLYRTNKAGEPQGKPLECCEHWSPKRRKLFCDVQWMLLSPFFCRSAYNHVNHYILKDQHLLPFIKSGSSSSDGAKIIDIGQRNKVHGRFSQVFFVHIHPEHHEFDDDDLDTERGFAVKQLTDEDHYANEKFTKEVNMLKKFTGDGAHSHVVSVLATYEQFGRFHLIFHRPNGDLFDYWKRICPSPKFDYATVVWVAKQLAGLADGLYRFHRHYTTPKTLEADQSSEDTNEKDHKNRPKDIFEEDIPTGTKCTRFQGDQLPHATNKAARPTQEDLITQYGRHGDLKPENLLWFPHRGDEKGILKIIDFGQAELHSENSKTYRQSRGIDTLTYRPPEVEIQPLMMRQSSDIWSLGCIYLEFVTWMFDGAEGVQSFKTSRLSYDPHLRMKSDKFFECVTVSGFEHDGAQLKHSVSKHIEDLASRADCSEYFKDVLGLIRDMLVIEPSEDHPPPNRRKCCGEVRNFLEKAYEKCLKTRSYAMGG